MLRRKIQAKYDGREMASVVQPADDNLSKTHVEAVAHMFGAYENKASDNLPQKNRNLNLHQCARSGDVDGVRELLEATSVGLNELDEAGLSPLHYGAKANKFDVVEALIQAGARVTIGDEDGATPLHYVAKKATQEHSEDARGIIRLLVSSKCDVNIRDRYASTPLHVAAMRGNVTVAEELLKYKQTIINCKDKLGCTPLHNCATFNRVKVAKLLISMRANIRATDNDKCTALHLSCMEGYAEMTRLLVNNCDENFVRDVICQVDKDGTSALHYAVEAHSYDIVNQLLKKDAHVNMYCRPKETGNTPLHLAAIAGHVKISELLIQKGALISSRNNRGATPLHMAAEFGSRPVTKLFLDKILTPLDVRDVELNTPLLTAVEYGHADLVSDLITEGADVTATDINDKNVIHLAAENEKLDCLDIILEVLGELQYSALDLINGQDKDGNTPLHAAAKLGNLDVVQTLLDAGADPADKNENEETPFLLAAQGGKMVVVEDMLKRNERVINDADEDSNTALHLAGEEGHLDVIKLLIEWGATKEARNSRAWTPLDVAAAAGHVGIVRCLLGEYVSPNPQDKDNITPLHLAARNGHEQVVMELIAAGGDVTALDVEHRNCLDMAIDHGQRKVVRVILESKVWHMALASESLKKQNSSQPRLTPLRRLIERMPDLTPLALDKCLLYGPDNVSINDKRRNVEFNFDYIDDMCTDYAILARQIQPVKLPEKANTLLPDTVDVYCEDAVWIKQNHPLTLLVAKAKREYEDLIGHPLILALIRHKWSVARWFYFIFLAFYVTFLSMVSAYMVQAEPPYSDTLNMTQCAAQGEWLQTTFEWRAKYVVWVFAGAGILAELAQILCQRWMYVQFINIIDWYNYISAIVLVIDIGPCGIRTPWQWQMGVFTVLFIWISMLIFLRRLPGIGIYVVMFTEILKTFAQFFIVFFLFIVAFALSYYLLLQDQEPFSSPFGSIIRTWVMMLQEFDYGDIFYDPDAPVPYRATTYAIFVIFIILMAIIINNLLTGLAVDDVNGLREHAKVVKLRIQVELALDIELALPKSWRRALNSTIRRQRLLLNGEGSSMWRIWYKVQRVIEGPLLCYDTLVEEAKGREAEQQVPELEELETRLSKQINQNTKEMISMNSNLNKIEDLLGKLVLKFVKPSGPRRKMTRQTIPVIN